MIKTYLLPQHALELEVGDKKTRIIKDGVALNAFTYLIMFGCYMLSSVLMVLQLFILSWLF